VSVLERLKKETMDNEIERKGKAFRREQFFKNIAKQV
jgi:hypothetical protein